MSQTSRILTHLKKRSLTALQAIDKFNCLRLAARISDLRAKGYNITTTTVRKGDKCFAKYTLEA